MNEMEDALLHEISQTQKKKKLLHDHSFMQNLKNQLCRDRVEGYLLGRDQASVGKRLEGWEM